MKIRRTLVANLFDKATKLSMKSMTETNSGKLISLISADLFTVERGLSIFPVLFAAPFINIFACVFLAEAVGWQYTGIVFGLWLLTMVLQYYSSKKSREIRGIESRINDERMKLVNDMVVGCRTIKCYGWEEHYIKKVAEIRKKQMGTVIKLNLVGALGHNLFSNMGLVAVWLILWLEWRQGNELKNEVFVSILAMVYFVFFSVNILTYFSLTNV